MKVFEVKEEGEHLVASKWRWDVWQRQEEEKRKRCVAFEEPAKRMLRYPEDSEDLKVSVSELKGQLETPEEAGFFCHADCQTGKE